MCANEMLMRIEEIDENIVEKYNDEVQLERIESSMADIIENLEIWVGDSPLGIIVLPKFSDK